MKKKQFKIASTVAGILILSLLLTYFLMSGTRKTINDASEQEGLALLTENTVQVEKIIEYQLANNRKLIYSVCIALEHMGKPFGR
ncbi:MAG: hypothetical protein ACI32B_04560 [Erysipelotrichaceae bacterium]